jgi:DNA-binding CsgD family transcriptional regulator
MTAGGGDGAIPRTIRLTTRELEVLRLMARGASNQLIAQQLVITVGTVKSHINHILGKLAAHNRTRQTYGPERLQHELAAHGVRVGIWRIRRIRKKLGLRCKQKRKFRATTDSKHKLPVAENLLGRGDMLFDTSGTLLELGVPRKELQDTPTYCWSQALVAVKVTG